MNIDKKYTYNKTIVGLKCITVTICYVIFMGFLMLFKTVVFSSTFSSQIADFSPTLKETFLEGFRSLSPVKVDVFVKFAVTS